MAEQRYKRAPSTTLYWDDGVLVLNNWYLRRRFRLDPQVFEVLAELDAYTSPNELAKRLPHWKPEVLTVLLVRLRAAGALVTQSDASSEEDIVKAWSRWGHPATYFHFSTRDLPYSEGSRDGYIELMRSEPQPALYKTYEGQEQLPLPRPPLSGATLADLLLRRRTVRSFRLDPIAFDDFARVLYFTWGQIGWKQSGVFGHLIKKTSPSGGARHPIEVYPVVRRVEGIPAGVYHYDVALHCLSQLRVGDFGPALTSALPGQPWVDRAAVVFVMTAVFERVMWKYRASRAYRVVLMDSGHLGQVFHLVATALSLGPFTSAAFIDSALEDLLQIDGVHESPLYVAATGSPDPSEPTRELPYWTEG